MKKPPQVATTAGPVALGKLLGRGGEGAVYDVAGKPDVVAKLYHEDASDERAAKLEAMRALLTPRLASLTAWPMEILYGANRRVRGFLMANVAKSKDIHALYSPKSRKVEFPQADWRMLVRAAANTARAFAVLHEAGCLVGDVNHGGIRVAPDATVRLVDCDSFQVSANGRLFRCEVGMENFTPPELQNQSLRDVVRTPNHDNFGLAVMMFYLLMMGRHPFAGRYLGKEEMPIERAIGQFRYAYGRDRARTRMDPPPHSAPVSAMSAAVVELWERAFSREGTLPGGRPTAAQWVETLSGLEHTIVRCAKEPTHYHVRAAGKCPWCPIESAGLSLFRSDVDTAPARTIADDGTIATAWAKIRAIAPPAKVGLPFVQRPAPSAAAQDVLEHRTLMLQASAIAAVVIVFGALIFHPGVLLLLFSLVFTTASVVEKRDKAIADFQARRLTVASRVRHFTTLWTREAASESFDEKLRSLTAMRDELATMTTERKRRFDELHAKREQNALTRFLERFDIEHAKLPGLRIADKAMLESYGIEDAADVSAAALKKVPLFHVGVRAELLAWRKSLEKQFRFDPASGIDPRDVRALDWAIAGRRAALEVKLREGPAQLEALRAQILRKRSEHGPALLAALTEQAQLTADLDALGGL